VVLVTLVSRWLICAHWRPKTSHPAPHHAAVHLRPAACRRTFRSVSVVVEGAGPPGHHLFGCGQARTLLMAVPPGAVVVIAVAVVIAVTVVIVVGGFGGPLFEHGHTVPPKLINSPRSLQVIAQMYSTNQNLRLPLNFGCVKPPI
jgi:hypothetical protein